MAVLMPSKTFEATYLSHVSSLSSCVCGDTWPLGAPVKQALPDCTLPCREGPWCSEIDPPRSCPEAGSQEPALPCLRVM